MEVQHTIANVATVSGRGLFGGVPVTVTFKAAPPNHGIVFERTDLGGARVPALVRYVVKRARRTSLRDGEASVDTCEHCMSALAGLQIDNVLIQMDGPELPVLDGSSKPYLDALQSAGIVESDAPRKRL